MGAVALRVMVSGLVGAIAGIHLDLWTSYGYRNIPTIGPLFLLNGIAGSVLALTSAALPHRLVPLAWLAVAGFAATTLATVLISLNGTVFGFHETTAAPLLTPSIIIEGTAVLAGITAAIWQLRPNSTDPVG